MKRFILIAAATMLSTITNAQDYSRALTEYQSGNLTSEQLITIIDNGTEQTTLDGLAASYITELKAEGGEVNANFFPGIDRIIGGFVERIKDDKLRNMLGFLFPTNKCDIEDVMIQRGIQATKEDYKILGREVPTAILELDAKYNK